MVRSLYSGVSGLKSHQTRMDVIGNNIANVNTYGFKASRTSFSDIYYQYQRSETGGNATYAGNNSSQVGYGVQVASIDKDMSSSSFQNTGRTLDMSIAGDGMFVCGTLDRNGQVSGVTYTRMGNFGIDSAGNLVNSNNEFVLGTINLSRLENGTYSSAEMIDRDPADTANAMDTININDLVWDAFKPDCEIDFDDVASTLKTADTTATPPRVQVIFTGTDPYDTTRQIAYDTKMNQNPPAAATDSDVATPTAEPGVEVASDYILYSVNGKYVNCQGVEYDTDKGLYKDKEGNYYTFQAMTTKDDTGKISKTYTYTPVTLANPTTDNYTNATAGTPIYTYNEINKTYEAQDANGNTIYADMTNGALKYSDLDAFSVGSDGVITGQYASQMKSLARVEIAVFDNIEGLSEIGDTAFIQTAASGEATIKRPGDSGAGEVKTSRLEMSNVNLANEFSDMIVTQRGYQANARVITTSDSMLEELVNLKR